MTDKPISANQTHKKLGISEVSNEVWLCLRFASLSLNCFGVRQASPEASAVVNQQQLYQVNEAALQCGVMPKQSMSHALMLLPSIQLIERDLYRENSKLEEISDWAYRFTSHVHVYNEHTLLLEVGRSLNLFKGLKHLQHLITQDLNRLGFDCCFGLAYTPKASFLLSFYPKKEWSLDKVDQHISNVELRHLAIDLKLIRQLHHCGFKRLADIQNIAKVELGERFGQEFVSYLERLHGTLADPQLFKVPDEVFRARIDFAEPISNRTWIEQQLDRLLNDLIEFLRSRNLVCRLFTWCFYNEKNHLLSTVNVSLASIKTDFSVFKELTDLQFENTLIKWEFSSIELSSHSLQRRDALSVDLFDPSPKQEEVNQLVEKLVNRLGEKSLYTVAAIPEHLPELASQKVSIDHKSPQGYQYWKERQNTQERLDNQEFKANVNLKDEPLWLLEKPKKINKINNKPVFRGALTLIHGPHRVTSHWWAKLQSRDYYMARQSDGCLLWVYYDRSSLNWYIHGLFA